MNLDKIIYPSLTGFIFKEERIGEKLIKIGLSPNLNDIDARNLKELMQLISIENLDDTYSEKLSNSYEFFLPNNPSYRFKIGEAIYMVYTARILFTNPQVEQVAEMVKGKGKILALIKEPAYDYVIVKESGENLLEY